MKVSLFLLVFVYACSTSETIIKPKEIVLEVPAATIQSDTLRVIESDSFDIKDIALNLIDDFKLPEESYEADFTLPNAKDKAVVKVYPKSKKAVLTLPKQVVKTTIQDTTKITIKKETTFTEKIGYVSYGIALVIVLIIAGIVIYFVKFRKT
ncbi:MAG: hypothetical protein FD143_3278 [Ignavibacteria bacterium]|nr:MAG: hypothetical protein FD143_3278 [Ignavibacteria bacterium]KAF0153668.1 MAG: hypothetical protein FD188_3371 [Ignavibacteria bacterium]